MQVAVCRIADLLGQLYRMLAGPILRRRRVSGRRYRLSNAGHICTQLRYKHVLYHRRQLGSQLRGHCRDRLFRHRTGKRRCLQWRAVLLEHAGNLLGHFLLRFSLVSQLLYCHVVKDGGRVQVFIGQLCFAPFFYLRYDMLANKVIRARALFRRDLGPSLYFGLHRFQVRRFFVRRVRDSFGDGRRWRLDRRYSKARRRFYHRGRLCFGKSHARQSDAYNDWIGFSAGHQVAHRYGALRVNAANARHRADVVFAVSWRAGDTGRRRVALCGRYAGHIRHHVT